MPIPQSTFQESTFRILVYCGPEVELDDGPFQFAILEARCGARSREGTEIQFELFVGPSGRKLLVQHARLDVSVVLILFAGVFADGTR